MSIPADRLRDLVRQMRHPLHEEELITDEEYAELTCNTPGAVARLESYDDIRAELAAVNTEIAALRAAAGDAQRDSERLDWIQKSATLGDEWPAIKMSGLGFFGANEGAKDSYSNIRAAIDAARAKEKP